MSWLLAREMTPDRYTHGLGLGLSGIALCLLELGHKEQACLMMQRAVGHRLIGSDASLQLGDAGLGLACLNFFHALGDEAYLHHARLLARSIIDRSSVSDVGRYWDTQGIVPVGLFYGASGIALFLLYTALSVEDEELLACATEAMRFDLAQGIETPEGRSWPYEAGSKGVTSPYLDRGTAGVGAALLRFIYLAQVNEFKQDFSMLYTDCIRKYTYNSSRFFGLAGIGDFHLDAYRFTRSEACLDNAYLALDGILLYSIPYDDAVAFPGSEQSKISCDFGTGMAGIAAFLARLIDKRPADFMLDDYYPHFS